jgi:hypothetical protein
MSRRPQNVATPIATGQWTFNEGLQEIKFDERLQSRWIFGEACSLRPSLLDFQDWVNERE